MKDNHIFRGLATVAAYGTTLDAASAAGKDVLQVGQLLARKACPQLPVCDYWAGRSLMWGLLLAWSCPVLHNHHNTQCSLCPCSAWDPRAPPLR